MFRTPTVLRLAERAPCHHLSHMGKHAPVLAITADGVLPAVANYLAIPCPTPRPLRSSSWSITVDHRRPGNN
ncbi:MAG: hypothetical protein H6661_13580 [Ardenticatenaceae bacterium]|nr:hypothetical protein [Ardenticatenaceae bacterium]